MKPLEAFSPKDIRTASRVLRLMINKSMSLDDLHELAGQLSHLGRLNVLVKVHKKKRTSEERALRKKALAGATYGKIHRRS